MYRCITLCCLLVLLSTDLSFSEEYNCISAEYKGLGNGEMIYRCREGCKGTFPNCVPACDHCPPNSHCTEPNFCTCNIGYKTIQDNGKLLGCQSLCESGCPPHSSCGERGKCECDVNYEEDKSNNHAGDNMMVCLPITITETIPDTVPDTIPDNTPICKNPCPANSDCVAIDKCECKTGFKEKSFHGGQLKCEKESDNTLSRIHIIVYSLVICALAFVICAAIGIVTVLAKRKNAGEQDGDFKFHRAAGTCEFSGVY